LTLIQKKKNSSRPAALSSGLCTYFTHIDVGLQGVWRLVSAILQSMEEEQGRKGSRCGFGGSACVSTFSLEFAMSKGFWFGRFAIPYGFE
jgi:hypothetical protein